MRAVWDEVWGILLQRIRAEPLPWMLGFGALAVALVALLGLALLGALTLLSALGGALSGILTLALALLTLCACAGLGAWLLGLKPA